jgi:hypothetical protein
MNRSMSIELEPVLVMPDVSTNYGSFQRAHGGAEAVAGAVA